MSDAHAIPESARQLLAVYEDHHAAERARTALLDAGVPAAQVHLDEREDLASGLRAEMLGELSRAVISPQSGVAMPRESGRGAVIAITAASVAALFAFPLGAIDLGGSYWVRVLIWAVVLAAAAGTVGLVSGAALGAPRPGAEPDAVRGTTLRVERDDAELRALLGRFGPMRLDEIDRAGGPVAAVQVEQDEEGLSGMVDAAADVAANASSDDYTPQRGPEAETDGESTR